MAKLRMARERVEKMLAERVRVGEDLDAKVKVAEKTGGYSDWWVTATGSDRSMRRDDAANSQLTARRLPRRGPLHSLHTARQGGRNLHDLLQHSSNLPAPIKQSASGSDVE